MELNGLLPVLRRWILVIVIATGVAMAIGWLVSSSGEKSYESTSVMLVGPLNTDNDTMRASGALAQTYAELATSESLLTRVAEETGAPLDDLEAGVRAAANSTTRFLTIRARAEEADTAREVAEAVTADLIAQSREGAVRPEGQLRLIDPAVAPDRPETPRGDLVIPLAAVAGLLGSTALVLLFEFVSDTAETATRVGEAAGIPTLAVSRRRRRLGRRGRHQQDPLRVVATQVELATPTMRCVSVPGASDRDGTPGLAHALARIWGERRTSLTVVDATGETLRTWGDATLTETVTSAAITEGSAQAVVDALAGTDGLVVVVAPSPVTSTASLVWSHVADVTLLGVRRFQTRQNQVRDAASNLRATGAEVPFVLLHDGGFPAPETGGRRHRAADSGGSAGSGSSADDAPTPRRSAADDRPAASKRSKGKGPRQGPAATPPDRTSSSRATDVARARR